jgi:hypothetical protein
MKGLFAKDATIYFIVYYLLLLLMSIGLPLSKALTSIVPGILIVLWMAEGRFKEKLQLLKQRKGLVLIISVFFIYVAGLLWTNSLKSGIDEIRIQLPLLALPLVIGTSKSLNYRQVKWIIYTFSLAVIVASACSMWVLLGFSDLQITDPREISLFISHIRFSLLINIAIFSLGWYLFNHEKKETPELTFLIVSIIWLSFFLVILKSATGWVVFFLISMLIAFRYFFRLKNRALRYGLVASLVVISVAPLIYLLVFIQQFYSVEKVPAAILQEKTSRGNYYTQDLKNKELENGHYIYLYLNEDELRDAWNKKSRLHYDTITVSGFNKFVLIRYMTSKGLRKDGESVEKLSAADIANIEGGMTNYRFANASTFYKRLYQIVWEIDSYAKGGSPSGHSVPQRLEYYKMALNIVRGDIWFGKGTGGYYLAYEEEFNKSKFFADTKYRQRSHNMFLSYWIDFGLIGMLYIIFALVSPVFIENKKRSALLVVFLLIVFISFINEDTLNNHDAISFFAFFYPLYLYSAHEKPQFDDNP